MFYLVRVYIYHGISYVHLSNVAGAYCPGKT